MPICEHGTFSARVDIEQKGLSTEIGSIGHSIAKNNNRRGIPISSSYAKIRIPTHLEIVAFADVEGEIVAFLDTAALAFADVPADVAAGTTVVA